MSSLGFCSQPYQEQPKIPIFPRQRRSVKCLAVLMPWSSLQKKFLTNSARFYIYFMNIFYNFPYSYLVAARRDGKVEPGISAVAKWETQKVDNKIRLAEGRRRWRSRPKTERSDWSAVCGGCWRWSGGLDRPHPVSPGQWLPSGSDSQGLPLLRPHWLRSESTLWY